MGGARNVAWRTLGQRVRTVVVVLGMLLAPAPAVRAIVFYATGDPQHNTTPPTGSLTNSGWQWQGDWLGFSATPISSNLFLTAHHLGGKVGDSLLLGGVAYPTVASFPDTNSDLVLWKVCGAFPDFAPMVEADAALTGQACVLFGRGLSRGAAVTVTNGAQTVLRGWRWGAGAGTLRWGENVIVAADRFVQSTFDAGDAPEEAMLASGDSGGGVFVFQGGRWLLAGVNYAVDGPFRFGDSGEPFFAALFDMRGLEAEVDPNVWQQVGGPTPQPARSYSTSVADRRAWIASILAAHSDPVPPVLEEAPAPDGPFAPTTDAVFIPDRRVWQLPLPAADRFYRLNGCGLSRIGAVRVTDGLLEVTWAASP